MFSRDREDIERREVSGVAPRVDIELRTDAPNELRLVAFRGKHPVRKSNCLLPLPHKCRTARRRLELDAKFFNRCSALAGRDFLFTNCQCAHRRPRAAPPL